ncbi:Tetratricopeptide repeat protein [Sulfidibacter corallicola]|uniref:Tetratricopeptide repeat protein n=1 Tax=Sulfidibacter corallicola TaxID=2818388 RepID=A0A8A4TK24_SULCO|nr:tetratricopeptide repeat protein [Sulfidibacter corallicola]QTD49492.1 tetratricopeptide repeat protein [Sulfidibacter corallicola]
MTSQVTALIEKARAARRNDRLDEARHAAWQALEAAKANADGPGISSAQAMLGQVARDCGDAPEAISWYTAAAEGCRQRNATRSLAHALRHIGDIHLDLQQLEKAEPLYEEALQIYRTQDDLSPLELANAIRSVALLKSQQNERASAIDLWREARSLYEATGIQPGVEECSDWLHRLDGREDRQPDPS